MTTGTIQFSHRLKRVEDCTIEDTLAAMGWHIDELRKAHTIAITNVDAQEGALRKAHNHAKHVYVLIRQLWGETEPERYMLSEQVIAFLRLKSRASPQSCQPKRKRRRPIDNRLPHHSNRPSEIARRGGRARVICQRRAKRLAAKN